MRLLLKLMPERFLARTTITLVMLLSLISTIAFGQNAKHEIIGTWTAEDKRLKFEVFQSDQEYDAHLLWGARVVEKDGVTFKLDSKNPDPALRSRSLKGIVFVTGLVWNKGSWTGGSIYDGSSGKTYNVSTPHAPLLAVPSTDQRGLRPPRRAARRLPGRTDSWGELQLA